MTIVLTILHVFVCIFLILVILLQAGRGHGLATSSFGAGAQTLFGTKTTAFMNRLTSICAIAFLVTSLGLVVFSMRSRQSVFAGKTVTEVPFPLKGMEKGQIPAEPAAKTPSGTTIPAPTTPSTPVVPVAKTSSVPTQSASAPSPVEKK